jgi:1,4-alpha-glucan branching enzyme
MMQTLTLWAPNAKAVELVDQNRNALPLPINLVSSTITYKNTSISGYWTLPEDANSPLQDGDGYWFKITFPDDTIKYRIDPYARALNNSVSYSIYKLKFRSSFFTSMARPHR